MPKLRTLLIGLLSLIPFVVVSCNLAKETADEGKEAGNKAVGVAEQMHKGTLGDEDLDDQ